MKDLKQLCEIMAENNVNLANDVFPELKTLPLCERLVSLSGNNEINKSGFKYKDKYLIFPVVLANNFHFTTKLAQLWNPHKENLQLSYDPNYLGDPNTTRIMILKSYWRGPNSINSVREKFREKNLVIFGAKEGFSSEIFDNVEFSFECREGKWHFEIEELLPLNDLSLYNKTTIGEEKYNYYTNYIHAITDIDFTKCFHLDGAIRVYNRIDNYKKRHINSANGIKTDVHSLCDRIKLFRLDSELGFSYFIELITLFFDTNPYVLEFFEGKNDFSTAQEDWRVDVCKYLWELNPIG